MAPTVRSVRARACVWLCGCVAVWLCGCVAVAVAVAVCGTRQGTGCDVVFGSAGTEPIVYHGGTLTSKLKFREAIKAVKQHAFVTSPYPIIITLENHCSLAGQQQLADTLKAVLRDHLFIPPGL